jgi:hypothetical protein
MASTEARSAASRRALPMLLLALLLTQAACGPTAATPGNGTSDRLFADGFEPVRVAHAGAGHRH